MKMFISPPAKTNWKVDPVQLSAHMQEYSPPVEFKVHGECSAGHYLEWTWLTPDGPVEGSLDIECTCVVVDGDVRRCAEFVVWFRTLVPKEQELVLYDEGYSADIMVTSESTAEDLAAPFLT